MSWGYPLDSFTITSKYGNRPSPYPDDPNPTNFHNGIDLRAGVGDSVYSINNGTVLSAYWTDKGGNQVIIEHDNGYRSGYAHLNSINVSEGQKVNKGFKIGTAGKTGGFTGMASHLHLTVKQNNAYIDPETLSWSAGGGMIGAIALILLVTSFYLYNK